MTAMRGTFGRFPLVWIYKIVIWNLFITYDKKTTYVIEMQTTRIFACGMFTGVALGVVAHSGL